MNLEQLERDIDEYSEKLRELRDIVQEMKLSNEIQMNSYDSWCHFEDELSKYTVKHVEPIIWQQRIYTKKLESILGSIGYGAI